MSKAERRTEVLKINLKCITAGLKKLENSCFPLRTKILYLSSYKSVLQTLSQDSAGKILISYYIHDLMAILRHSEEKLNITIYYTRIFFSKVKKCFASAFPNPSLLSHSRDCYSLPCGTASSPATLHTQKLYMQGNCKITPCVFQLVCI